MDIISKWILMLFFIFIFYLSLVPASHAETPDRIVSLAPAITEILFAAGLGDRIAGVTSFCDYPEEAKTKPKIGGMSNPSLEAVFSLKPDIVIMTTDGNPKEFKQRLRDLNIKTHVFEALTLDELPDGIREIGSALDEKKRFDAVALGIEQAMNRFRTPSKQPAGKQNTLQTTGGQAEHPPNNRRASRTQRKKVLFIIWPEPLIVAGPKTAVDDAINLLGHINIAGHTNSRYPKYSIEEIMRQSPDIIFFGRGKGMEKISGRLLKRLSNVQAVRDGKVFYVSDSLYRLGPRAIKGIEELAGYLQEVNPKH